MLKLFSDATRLNIAHILIIFEITAMLVSTSVAVGVEFILYLLFIVSGELRHRFVASLKQPMVLMIMLFYAVITAGLFYGLASWEEGVDFWSAWRKLLLVPLVASVFDNPSWKRHLAVVFIGFTTVAAMVSMGSYFLDHPVYYQFPVGVVLTNHGTQGMALALAIFAIAILMRFFPLSKKGVWLALIGMAVMIFDLIFVNTGRSGYLAFLVFGMAAMVVVVPGKIRYLLVLIMPVLVGLLLMASPVAKQRIALGLSNIVNLDQADHYSAMGIRMVIYKNILKIMKDPNFPVMTGYGTGSFRGAYRLQVAGQTGWKAEVVNDTHNQFLSIVIEHGIVGLIFFFGFIGACFRQTVSPPFKVLGIGALLAWCATCLFNSHFNTFAEGRMIFIWLGAMLAMPVASVNGGAA